MSDASALADLLRPIITSERVLEAIASVPRDRFVPPHERERAYENMALPIGCGQTISQPLVVARMLELLELGEHDRVLDVGTGSGYHAALLARLAGEVWTIERHPELSAEAERTIRALGIDNVAFAVGNGSAGLAERGPFDAINVAAAAASVPVALQEQLAPGGRLIAPVGGAGAEASGPEAGGRQAGEPQAGSEGQYLTLIRRTGEHLEATRLDPVRFVPLIGGDR